MAYLLLFDEFRFDAPWLYNFRYILSKDWLPLFMVFYKLVGERIDTNLEVSLLPKIKHRDLMDETKD